MKADKVFKWIWNFNGIAILAVTFIFTVLIGYQLISDFYPDEPIEVPKLNLAEDDKNQENWRLGFPLQIGNSDFHYIALESENLTVERKRSNVQYFSGGGYTKTRAKNLIFINDVTNQSNWLFDSIEQLIINMEPIVKGNFNSPGKAFGMSYEVINNDGKLSYVDKRTFSLSKIDGSKYKKIISDYDRIVNSSLNTEDNLFVVFIKDNSVYSMVIDMVSFNIISKNQLPKVGNT